MWNSGTDSAEEKRKREGLSAGVAPGEEGRPEAETPAIPIEVLRSVALRVSVGRGPGFHSARTVNEGRAPSDISKRHALTARRSASLIAELPSSTAASETSP